MSNLKILSNLISSYLHKGFSTIFLFIISLNILFTLDIYLLIMHSRLLLHLPVSFSILCLPNSYIFLSLPETLYATPPIASGFINSKLLEYLVIIIEPKILASLYCVFCSCILVVGSTIIFYAFQHNSLMSYLFFFFEDWSVCIL